MNKKLLLALAGLAGLGYYLYTKRPAQVPTSSAAAPTPPAPPQAPAAPVPGFGLDMGGVDLCALFGGAFCYQPQGVS